MSFVITAPKTLAAAAGGLTKTWYDLVNTEVSATRDMTSVVAPGADVVSKEVQRFLAAHTKQYQKVSERAWLIFDRFGDSVSSAADMYLTAEEDNAEF
ncbi:PE family protein [Mycobacterium haemophilum]|uniref:PE domain-containing protein n=1 Tax=Mycobacterium haemophilum TaxID=29311 RepID=A0A0I9UT24_9MYCO|nr:PE family protein [Mycobacterium haemophilum]KLO26129.1 hypothetical protein ABH39_18465 [Mycobacterium haemophilum]KLO34510.1 hypothetical protein ABH38_18590 [Mycobacterium haemophilum]KLO37904.1 hypothetical protein ABH37_18885 [Mycobacterium haemophilum]KLO46249.1 hypothetical protein ABH36_18295 [Mycobacterium haemophilum]